MLLKGARLLLTGASGGVGSETARRLAQRGAALLLAGRDRNKLEALARELRQQGAEAAIIALDLKQPEALAILADAAREFGVDGVIHNAGINSFALFQEEDPARVEAVLETNLLAPMLLTRALLPWLQQRDRAAIIFIGSTFGSLPFAGFAAYSAAKAGLRGFAQALRRELADSRVEVILIAPRAIATPLNSSAVDALNREMGSQVDAPEDAARQIVEAIAAGRAEVHLGFPERLFAWLNAVAPRLIDAALKGKLALIKRHARSHD